MNFKGIIFIFCLIGFLGILEAKDYKGAELRTKESFLYGRFEVRYRASRGGGQTSTFFTYNDDFPNTDWNEIDIEILGRYTNDVQFNTITPNRLNHLRHQYIEDNPFLDFHVYTIEWTPDYVAWFIDGTEVYRQSGPHIATLIHPQKIMMNIWNPAYANWVGSFHDEALPFFAYYDYVSYASYTPGTGDVGTNLNFTHQWTDHFDAWDQSRWDKASHTWSGNNADFIHENCVFQDGYMILCLTDNTHTGYTDKNPPVALWARCAGDSVTVLFSEDLDETSAQTTGNYIIQGVTVQEADIKSDKRTVVLKTAGIDPNSSYNVIILGLKDLWQIPNIQLGQVLSVWMSNPLTHPVHINVGGEAFEDFLPDQEWSHLVEYGYMDGAAYEISNQIEIIGTDLDVVYRSQKQGLVAYTIRVPNGMYNVTLMTAELQFDTPGNRIFDLFIEDEIISHLDIFNETGKNSAHNIIIEGIEVFDQQLDIHCGAITWLPVLNGIMIEKNTTGIMRDQDKQQHTSILVQNYPNPFNNMTTISYTLPFNGDVHLSIYNSMGQEVTELVNGFQETGTYHIRWVPEQSSGSYIYRLLFNRPQQNLLKAGRMIYLK